MLPGTDTSLGAFGLLGIPVGEPDDAEVRTALGRQLGRLASHPQGSTAQADEVRLALHVAAAQLRDLRVRREIVAQLAKGAAGEVGGDAVLDELVLGLIALCGGWNSRSKRLVASVLHSYGKGHDELSRIVRSAGKREHARWHGVPRPAGETHPEVGAPTASLSPRGRVVLGVLSAALIMATAGLLAAVVSIQRERMQSSVVISDTDVQNDFEDHPVGIVPRFDAPDVSHDEDSADGGNRLVAHLKEIGRSIQSDPRRAVGLFRVAVGELSTHWTVYEREHVVAANQAVVVFIRDCVGPGVAGDAIDAVLAQGAGLFDPSRGTISADAIHPGVWSAAMAHRLEREPSIPRSSMQRIDWLLTYAIPVRAQDVGRGFWGGANASLSTLSGMMVPGRAGAARVDRYEPAWKAWLECVQASNEHQPSDGEQLALDSILFLLEEGAEPSLDDRAHAVLWVLLAALEWDASPTARESVVAWFDDAHVSVGDLSEVTAWIAGYAEVGGVEVDMALSATADIGSRQSLRDRYAGAWGLRTRRESSVLERRWAEDAQRALQDARAEESGVRALEAGVRLALLSQAAAQRWGGEDAAGETTLRDSPGRIQEALSSRGGEGNVRVDIKALTSDARGRDGEWAARFQEARRQSTDAIRSLGELLSRREPLGPADADMLAEAAFFATPEDVRGLAQRLVRERAGNVAVIYGLLEAGDQMPRTPGIKQMLEEVCGRALPGAQDPAFRAAARRAIVSRVLEMLAEQNHGVIDRLAAVLGEAYGARAGALGGGSGGASINTGIPSLASAREWEAWRSTARGFEGIGDVRKKIGDIDRRRTGRHALTRGSMQGFVAEQASIVEMMAVVVGQENASESERIGALLERFAGQRRVAQDIFQQILAGERAIVELWLIRFGDIRQEDQSGGKQ
jgi:hypothetical protein